MVTSEDIVSREFTIVMRGYERHEVDEHLRGVAADMGRLAGRVAELEQQLRQADQQKTFAEPDPADGFRALGEETTRILVAAESASRDMREKAERQADAELAAAERAARERVETASDHAASIIAEAEGRRDDIEAELRRLEQVRVELVSQLENAVRITSNAVGSLEPTGASMTAARTTAPVREPAPEPVREPAPAAKAPGTVIRIGSDGDSEVSTPEPAAAPKAAPAPKPEPKPEPVAPEAEPELEPVAEAEPAPFSPGADEAETETAAVAEVSHDEHPHGADPSALEAAMAEAAVAAGREPAPVIERDVEAGMLRERSLAGIRPGMLRRLRRGLQELQNGVLESVREREVDGDVDVLLPGADAAASLSDVGRVFLDAGYRAGRADAPVLRGDQPLEDPPTDGRRVATAADTLAEELLAELRTTLAPSLRAGADAGEPGASLSERVGEVFRDLKGPVIETVVDRHLTRVYGEATLDGWKADGVSEVLWVLGDESRCPEGMCRANEAEGAIELGSDFPSGHPVPPVHEGCTCALTSV